MVFTEQLQVIYQGSGKWMHSVNVLNYLILKFNRMKLMIQCGILSYDSFAILTVPLSVAHLNCNERSCKSLTLLILFIIIIIIIIPESNSCRIL